MKNNYIIFYLKKRKIQFIGVIIVLISLLLVVIGPYITPHDSEATNVRERLLPPSREHFFGTDSNGMDIFSRIIAAYRIDFMIAFIGVLIAMIIGSPLGVFAGYFDGEANAQGFISNVLLRIADIAAAFPLIVLGLLLVATFGPSPLNIIFVIAIGEIPPYLRLTRSETLALKNKQFVEAARAQGYFEVKIAFKEILPNSLNQSIAMVSYSLGCGILTTAGLSFIGAGIQVPTPEWGLMISAGASQMITGQWWPAFFPGLIMAITIFGFSMVGDVLIDLIDPLKRVELGFRH